MKFSLILATLGRTDELGRFLESLRAQTHQNYELIVVDQNEDCRISDVIQPFQNLINIIHLRSAPGLSRARNIGLRHITGDIVCFPDDDCWYHDNLLEQVAQWFKVNIKYMILSGCYSEPNVENPYFASNVTTLTTANIFKQFQLVSSVSLFIRCHIFTMKKYCFNERLGVGAELPAGEETDLVLHILEDQYLGKYDPNIIVFHKISRESNTNKYSKLAREEANAYVLAIHALKPNFYLIYKTFFRLIKPLVKGIFDKEYSLIARYRRKGFMKALASALTEQHPAKLGP